MKNSKTIRLISLFILTIMLISSFAACAETNPSDETTAGPSNAETQAPVHALNTWLIMH